MIFKLKYTNFQSNGQFLLFIVDFVFSQESTVSSHFSLIFKEARNLEIRHISEDKRDPNKFFIAAFQVKVLNTDLRVPIYGWVAARGLDV